MGSGCGGDFEFAEVLSARGEGWGTRGTRGGQGVGGENDDENDGAYDYESDATADMSAGMIACYDGCHLAVYRPSRMLLALWLRLHARQTQVHYK